MPVIRSRKAYTLVEMLLVMAILGVLAGLGLCGIQNARHAAVRKQCESNIHQIGVALHHFHTQHGVLPPGVSNQSPAEKYPFMGWHTRILPYLGESGLWQQAMDGYAKTPNFKDCPPHCSDAVLKVFGCPADPRLTAASKFGFAMTSYLGVEGIDLESRDGVLFLNSRIRLENISNGLSNTLLIGERPPSADERLGWWYAGWGQAQTGSAEMVLGVEELAVGEWLARCERGPYAFRPGKFDNQCDAFHFWSPHPGGANFCFADGSVRFLSYSAAPLMPALATRAGGEPATSID